MTRICTCSRCKAEDFVRSVYPRMNDRRVLLVAQDILKAMYASVETSFRMLLFVRPSRGFARHTRRVKARSHR